MKYKTISEYFYETLGERVRKIPVAAGLGCPCHCTYCNNDSFSPAYADKKNLSITGQIEAGIRFSRSNKSLTHAPESFLVYFQSHTNTFGPSGRLIELYEEALAYPGVRGLVIATRPDCLSRELMDWMGQRFGNAHAAVPVGESRPFLLVEIGIESTKDATLERVRRGHTFECARNAILELDRRGIDTGAHIIIGLPGETESDFLNHARALNGLPIKTLKLHQLQIVKGSPMAEEYLVSDRIDDISLLSAEEYAAIVRKFIAVLRSDIALDRFVSEAPLDMVLAPRWGIKPAEFLKLL